MPELEVKLTKSQPKDTGVSIEPVLKDKTPGSPESTASSVDVEPQLLQSSNSSPQSPLPVKDESSPLVSIKQVGHDDLDTPLCSASQSSTILDLSETTPPSSAGSQNNFADDESIHTDHDDTPRPSPSNSYSSAYSQHGTIGLDDMNTDEDDDSIEEISFKLPSKVMPKEVSLVPKSRSNKSDNNPESISEKSPLSSFSEQNATNDELIVDEPKSSSRRPLSEYEELESNYVTMFELDSYPESDERSIPKHIADAKTITDLDSVFHNYEAQLQDSIEQPEEREFWQDLIANPSEFVAENKGQIGDRMRRHGVPPKIRGIVWKSLCNTQNMHDTELYRELVLKDTDTVQDIKRDLGRTFPSIPIFQENSSGSKPTNTVVNSDSELTSADYESLASPATPSHSIDNGQSRLFRVLKAYANYDPEVGYCQGLAFIVAILLMNMDEESSFWVLVKLMESHGLRTMYTQNLEGLHERAFQFECLGRMVIAPVFEHLDCNGVHTISYVTSWFMTLFANTAPLSFVLRVMDVIMLEGAVETMMLIGLALIKRKASKLRSIDDSALLQAYLTKGLYNHNNQLKADRPSTILYGANTIGAEIITSKLVDLSMTYKEKKRQKQRDHTNSSSPTSMDKTPSFFSRFFGNERAGSEESDSDSPRETTTTTRRSRRNSIGIEPSSLTGGYDSAKLPNSARSFNSSAGAFHDDSVLDNKSVSDIRASTPFSATTTTISTTKNDGDAACQPKSPLNSNEVEALDNQLLMAQSTGDIDKVMAVVNTERTIYQSENEMLNDKMAQMNKKHDAMVEEMNRLREALSAASDKQTKSSSVVNSDSDVRSSKQSPKVKGVKEVTDEPQESVNSLNNKDVGEEITSTEVKNLRIDTDESDNRSNYSSVSSSPTYTGESSSESKKKQQQQNPPPKPPRTRDINSDSDSSDERETTKHTQRPFTFFGLFARGGGGERGGSSTKDENDSGYSSYSSYDDSSNKTSPALSPAATAPKKSLDSTSHVAMTSSQTQDIDATTGSKVRKTTVESCPDSPIDNKENESQEYEEIDLAKLEKSDDNDGENDSATAGDEKNKKDQGAEVSKSSDEQEEQDHIALDIKDYDDDSATDEETNETAKKNKDRKVEVAKSSENHEKRDYITSDSEDDNDSATDEKDVISKKDKSQDSETAKQSDEPEKQNDSNDPAPATNDDDDDDSATDEEKDRTVKQKNKKDQKVEVTKPSDKHEKQEADDGSTPVIKDEKDATKLSKKENIEPATSTDNEFLSSMKKMSMLKSKLQDKTNKAASDNESSSSGSSWSDDEIL